MTNQSAAQTYWDDMEEGQEISLDDEWSSQRLVIWAAASGDFYQIHYDEQFAKANALPGVIVHGALKGMVIGRLLDELIGTGGRIVKWTASYRGMDPVGQHVRVWAKVTRTYEQDGEALVDFDVGVAHADGTQTTPGTATVALPKRG